MTLPTNRNNVEPMLRFIAGMMVILCLCGAVMAFQGVLAGQFAGFNSFIYSTSGLLAFRMFNIISFLSLLAFIALLITIFHCPAFLRLFITPFRCLKSFCLASPFSSRFTFGCFMIFLLVLFIADFALILTTIFGLRVLRKFQDRFNLFANVTGFCFNRFSHLILSLQKNYLVRAGCWHLPAVGSLYCISNTVNVESFYNNFWKKEYLPC